MNRGKRTPKAMTALFLCAVGLAGASAVSADGPAASALEAFERSTRPSAWQNLQPEKSKIIGEIRERLTNPFAINQKSRGYCMPASVVFELVRRKPERYVQICQSLFETGSFEVDGLRVSATTSLLRNAPPADMARVDWMLLGTLYETRNASNWIEKWQEWTQKLLGCEDVRWESTYWFGEESALERAGRVVANGGVAFIYVDASLLPGQSGTFWADPDHALALLGNVHIEEGWWSDRIQFDVYSWGKRYHIDMEEWQFERFFWGVVTGGKPRDAGPLELTRVELNREYSPDWLPKLAHKPGPATAGAQERSFDLGWDFPWTNGSGQASKNRSWSTLKLSQLPARLEQGIPATITAVLRGEWSTTGYGINRARTVSLDGDLGEAKWSTEVEDPNGSRQGSCQTSKTITLTEPDRDHLEITIYANLWFGGDHHGFMTVRLIYDRKP